MRLYYKIVISYSNYKKVGLVERKGQLGKISTTVLLTLIRFMIDWVVCFNNILKLNDIVVNKENQS